MASRARLCQIVRRSARRPAAPSGLRGQPGPPSCPAERAARQGWASSRDSFVFPFRRPPTQVPSLVRSGPLRPATRLTLLTGYLLIHGYPCCSGVHGSEALDADSPQYIPPGPVFSCHIVAPQPMMTLPEGGRATQECDLSTSGTKARTGAQGPRLSATSSLGAPGPAI